jgi:hypothetical protein
MKGYAQASAAFFSLLAIVQLIRVVLGWPVQVAGVQIPIWASIIAFLIVSALAVWGFRSTSRLTAAV